MLYLRILSTVLNIYLAPNFFSCSNNKQDEMSYFAYFIMKYCSKTEKFYPLEQLDSIVMTIFFFFYSSLEMYQN